MKLETRRRTNNKKEKERERIAIHTQCIGRSGVIGGHEMVSHRGPPLGKVSFSRAELVGSESHHNPQLPMVLPARALPALCAPRTAGVAGRVTARVDG